MKYFALCVSLLFVMSSVQAQFNPTKDGLMILVSDGTDKAKNSEIVSPKGIPDSYDQISRRRGGSASAKGSQKDQLRFTDPIRELGMKNCIQAAAFLKRPQYGKKGFMLIFSINDAIGGQQATIEMDGKTYKGVYRLVKQKTSSDEKIPEGMTNYKIEGKFFLLGIS
ncbi:MAG: hypothetical protein AAF573_16045 [Bacteroidota bacterium]